KANRPRVARGRIAHPEQEGSKTEVGSGHLGPAGAVPVPRRRGTAPYEAPRASGPGVGGGVRGHPEQGTFTAIRAWHRGPAGAVPVQEDVVTLEGVHADRPAVGGRHHAHAEQLPGDGNTRAFTLDQFLPSQWTIRGTMPNLPVAPTAHASEADTA